jgi:hypothetical protein
METQKSPWYLLTGLILGFVLGFIISQVFSPQLNTEASPDLLTAAQKNAYRLLIAEAYHANPDLLRASSRLALLVDPDPIQALSAQAQRSLGTTAGEIEAQLLASLATALQLESPPSLQTPSN